ncbi:MAG TPA: hypothetical protein VFI46_06910 [Jiangellaceae bacterium]|nr:hypothetical protein [Jiangellaceae bacterium]
MDDRDAAAIDWLLGSHEPAVRYLTRRDVLGEDVSPDREEILRGPKVQALLSEQRPVHPYRKWYGAHWRLVSLVELAVPPTEPRVLAALESVLGWLTGQAHRRAIKSVNGLTRRCASQEGNALAVAARLGCAAEPRVKLLARSLVEWQWPDGGWNCDVNATGYRSSFHESLTPMWGLVEFGRAADADWALQAAARTAELFLDHRIFRRLQTGEVIDRRWLSLRYPSYWHYDVLASLLLLGRAGKASDSRAADAIAHLRERQHADGRWSPGGYWWSAPGAKGPTDVVDWGRSRPNEMITLNALRALRSAQALN